MNLTRYGWTDERATHFSAANVPDGQPARVTAEHRDRYLVQAENGELIARVSGRMRHVAANTSELPAVGDWVVVATDDGGVATIRAVLPRVSTLSRKVAGSSINEQVIAANIDIVWIVAALDVDLNFARLERYLTVVWESGAIPVIVLTKTDVVQAPDLMVAEIGSRLPGVPVHPVSALLGTGRDELLGSIPPTQTVALVGPSGVGKSTLVNWCVGRATMAVGSVRVRDGKGRHTTTHREIVPLESGGLLLDTPGMRELQLWSGEGGIAESFDDIEVLASQCRFTDCRHDTEPGCAVRIAIESGALALDRFASYEKLQRELQYMERKVNVRAALDEKRRIKQMMKDYRRGLTPES